MSAVLQEVRIPNIGESSDVTIVEILVTPGDLLNVDDNVITVESDKATLDVPTSLAGRVVSINVAVGDAIAEGGLMLTLEADSGDLSDEVSESTPAEGAIEEAHDTDASASDNTVTPILTPVVEHVEREEGEPVPFASPAIRRLARELGVDPGEIHGSGLRGRILKQDVHGYVKDHMNLTQGSAGASASGFAPMPVIDFEKFGPTERRPLGRIAKLSGPNLARNAALIPHVTSFDKADITDLEAFRKTINADLSAEQARVTLLAFVVRATATALNTWPQFNASLDGDEIVIKRYCNIGIAANTPEGLFVPVIKNADTLGVMDIAREITRLGGAARSGTLSMSELQGATFSISSLGGVGGTGFTPIINAPEAAILGLSRAAVEPVWMNDAVAPRLIQPLSLSWDHRIVDGVEATRFLDDIKNLLSDVRRIIAR